MSRNANDCHCTLEEAAKEIERRNADRSLKAAVEAYLGNRMPSHFNGSPRALYWPHIATPNIWMDHVIKSADILGLQPICLEYLTDKFHPGNETKRHLGLLRFFHGRGRNGGCKTSNVRVVDINSAAGCRFTDINTFWGENLVTFHHRLMEESALSIPVLDMSVWIDSWGTIVGFYDAYMSLCVCHCVLFESFRCDGCDCRFTENVFIPAFERAHERFGVKPLIVSLEPLDGPSDLYWYSYAESVKPLVLAAMTG